MRVSQGHVEYLEHKRYVSVFDSITRLVGEVVTFLISTSLFLAASGVCKLYLSFLLYDIAPRWNLLAATFLLVFSVYGLNKLTDIKEDKINNPERVKYVEKAARVLEYSVPLSFILSVILSILTSPWAVLIVLFPIVSGILYSIRITPKYPRLKDVTGVKNLIIAITWANGTAFLPYLAVRSVTPQKVILVYYFFFMKSLINTLLFDIRDMEGDKINGINTIPVKFGLGESRILLLVLNSTFIPWLLVAYRMGYFAVYLPALVFAILNGYVYILYFTRRGRNPGKGLDVWVDGEWFYTLPLALSL